MKRLYFLNLILVFLFSSIGCSHFYLVRTCEDKNWFEYGKNTALSGRTLESDTFINQCQRAGANVSVVHLDLGFKSGRSKYCKPEFASLEARQGRHYQFDFCDFTDAQSTSAHRFFSTGLDFFCSFDQGAIAASQGWEYNEICQNHPNQHSFLIGYRKGRQEYLTAEVDRVDQEIKQKKRELAELQQLKVLNQQQSRALFEQETDLGRLRRRAELFRRQYPNRALPMSLRVDVFAQANESLQMQRLTLNSQLSEINRRSAELNQELSSLRSKRAKLNSELKILSKLDQP